MKHKTLGICCIILAFLFLLCVLAIMPHPVRAQVLPLETIGSGNNPLGVATDNALYSTTGNEYVFVANSFDGSVSVYVTTGTGATSTAPVYVGLIDGFSDPTGVAVSPTGTTNAGDVYVTNSGAGTVSVIVLSAFLADPVSYTPTSYFYTTTSLLSTSDPTGIAVSPATGYIYVANSVDDSVAVIEPTSSSPYGSLLTTIPGFFNPTGVAVAAAPNSPGTVFNYGYVYVTNCVSASEGGSVSVIVPSSSPPYYVSVSPAASELNYPTGVAVSYALYYPSSANGLIGVADPGDDSVLIITPTSATAYTSYFEEDSSGPTAVANSPYNGDFLVTNTGPSTGTVSVINPNLLTPFKPLSAIIGPTIPVAADPMGIAVSQTTGYIYVTNYGSYTVSVIDPELSADFLSVTSDGLNPIGMTQTAGVPFDVTVIVRDAYGYVDTSWAGNSGTADLKDQSGMISPMSLTFSGGTTTTVVTIMSETYSTYSQVTINAPYSDDYITATVAGAPTITGESNTFNVNAAPTNDIIVAGENPTEPTSSFVIVASETGTYTVSVTSPYIVTAGEDQYICTGYDLNDVFYSGETSHTFSDVTEEQVLAFTWQQQFMTTFGYSVQDNYAIPVGDGINQIGYYYQDEVQVPIYSTGSLGGTNPLSDWADATPNTNTVFYETFISTPTAVEQWAVSNGLAGYPVSSAGSISGTFYHQYMVNFGYFDQDLSPIPTGTQIGNYYQCGNELPINALSYVITSATTGTGYGTTTPANDWANANSMVVYETYTVAPSDTERWAVSSVGYEYSPSAGSISLSGIFYHQFIIFFGYFGTTGTPITSGTILGFYFQHGSSDPYIYAGSSLGTTSPPSDWVDASPTPTTDTVFYETAIASSASGPTMWSLSTPTVGYLVTASAAISSPTYSAPEYGLTMATNYGTTTPTSVGVTWYTPDTMVTITATAPMPGPGEQYVWNGWTGLGTGSFTSATTPTDSPTTGSTITMSGPITETASWIIQYTTTSVTFKESGLPLGTYWWVKFNGATEWSTTTTTTTTIVFSNVASGSYSWEVSTPLLWLIVSQYAASPSSGTMIVPSQTAQTITYTHQYLVAVIANPIPANGGKFDVTYTMSGTTYVDQPGCTPWIQWADANTPVTVSSPQSPYIDCSGYSFTFGSYTNNAVTMNSPQLITLNYYGALDHFVFSCINSPQTAGTLFNIMITAEDAFGNPVLNYNGPTTSTTTLTETSGGLGGTVSPSSVTFINGVYNGPVSVTKSGSDVTITATHDGMSSTSSPFTVNAGALHQFVFSNIATQTSGKAFLVTITAEDQYGNTVTSYSGKQTLAVSSGTLTPTTVTFTKGVASNVKVTITVSSSRSVYLYISGYATLNPSNTFNVKPS